MASNEEKDPFVEYIQKRWLRVVVNGSVLVIEFLWLLSFIRVSDWKQLSLSWKVLFALKMASIMLLLELIRWTDVLVIKCWARGHKEKTCIGLNRSEVIDLLDTNFDHYISTYELVFVNFHAEWCRFSQMLGPVLKETDLIIGNEVKAPNRILFARVDCDQNRMLSNRYKISKYPTLKLFLNGKAVKKEYRGQRNHESIVEYVKTLLSDAVVHIDYGSHTDLSAIMYNKSSVIGYYVERPERHQKYDIFRKVASDMRGFCDFYWVTNSPYIPEGKTELLAFKSSKSTKQSEYDFVFETYDELSAWSTYLCLPVVREITFDNAEEIIEEGIPLVILFHNRDDEKSTELFKDVILRELLAETSDVNFVTADADLFAHPISHLGKTKSDLPFIAIDSFKHMYLFPKFEDLNKTHIMENFIQDLKSGKLHKEFHFGPEGEIEPHHHHEEEAEEEKEKEEQHKEQEMKTEVEEDEDDDDEEGETEPEDVLTPIADSVFKKLGPSQYRYTLLKDEL